MNCEDLMNIPKIYSGMKLIAGGSGMYRNIRWIYFANCTQCLSDDFKVSQLIHGGELVIVTNAALTDNDDKMLSMIVEMNQKNIAGLVINVGQISPMLTEYCNDNELPLFELSYDLHLIDLSQIVCKALVEEESNTNSIDQLLAAIIYSSNINDADILILAGDTMYWDEDYLQNPFWDTVSSAFAQVLVIPGNHEFYKGFDLASLQKSASGTIRDNVHWYYNQSVVLDGVQIILSTLWSHIPSTISERIQTCGNDFACIQYEKRPITIEKYNDENRLSIDYITKELQKKYAKRIIVSHHAPILKAISEQLQNSWYASLYANNLDELIKKNSINYWIYGHSHQYRESFRIHDTELVTNPCGYMSKKENTLFDLKRVIVV